MRKTIGRNIIIWCLTLLFIIPLLCGCSSQRGEAVAETVMDSHDGSEEEEVETVTMMDSHDGSEEEEVETVTIIDRYDEKKTKSYPDNQDGLAAYISDLMMYDLTDHIETITGEIKETYAQSLIARVRIKPDSKDEVLEYLTTFATYKTAEESWLSDCEAYYPPGMGEPIQIELQESSVIGSNRFYYSGLYGETCSACMYILDKGDSIELLVF